MSPYIISLHGIFPNTHILTDIRYLITFTTGHMIPSISHTTYNFGKEWVTLSWMYSCWSFQDVFNTAKSQTFWGYTGICTTLGIVMVDGWSGRISPKTLNSCVISVMKQITMLWYSRIHTLHTLLEVEQWACQTIQLLYGKILKVGQYLLHKYRGLYRYVLLCWFAERIHLLL